MKKYILESSEQEVHMQGDYVGVAWNMEWEEKALKDEEGTTYKKDVLVRRAGGKPYITFCAVGEDLDTKKFILSPYCSALGEIGYSTAKQVLKELQAAVAYLGTLEAGG